ncbi:MAG: class I SAM-dependent methyltransferase family protein [Candidatus Bathyarchaeota archaeon]|nr:class I SAM-dependent methyltransferase family protein [Candidatus Bathyarchaeota archaeon]
MNEPSTVKTHSLKVQKKLGEKAIRLATKLGLLSRELKVLSDAEHLWVPLNQKPMPAHVDQLDEALQQYDIVVKVFSRRVKPLRTAFEIAGDRLPPHLLASFPRSMDLVGDIAVVEVPPELEEHKSLIGEAVLEAHKNVRTVLAKSSAVGGIRRLREYEVIAGSSSTETVHREHGCKYHLDLKKVYFSPRLSHEHRRIASQVRENETVVDLFAGVGPFSILIAKTHRNVEVYAVDVNPDAVRYLERNVTVNGVPGKVVPILGDAGTVVRERLRGKGDRVIMNLPEKAIEYLGVACEVVKPEGGVIHYYEFAEGPDPIKTVEKRLAEAVNRTSRRIEKMLSARKVREVAPFRWQVAVDIQIH